MDTAAVEEVKELHVLNCHQTRSDMCFQDAVLPCGTGGADMQCQSCNASGLIAMGCLLRHAETTHGTSDLIAVRCLPWVMQDGDCCAQVGVTSPATTNVCTIPLAVPTTTAEQVSAYLQGS